MSTRVDGPSALRARLYGEKDLSSSTVFAGGYINFGYWAGIPLDGPLTVADRTASQEAMYRLVLDGAEVGPGQAVVEIGCGLGLGAALALAERAPDRVLAIDVSEDQIARARRLHDDDRLELRVGSALAIPAPDGAFDALVSVEATQHFDDLAQFAREAFRVLRPGGRLSVASFFVPADARPDAEAELPRLIKNVRNGVDSVGRIGSFARDLAGAGFAEVAAGSIGATVWEGLDRWIAGTEHRHGWGRNWLRAHRLGLVDYYLVTAAAGGAGP